MAMKSAKPDFQTVKHYTPHFISSKKKKNTVYKVKRQTTNQQKIIWNKYSNG